ncbi:MAG: MG2 domain-containing protein [Bacteroides sp.]|nr:MG2 domain-containing protein [Bacteroides sp.]
MIAYKKIVVTCLCLLFISTGNTEPLLRERIYVQTDKQTYLAGEWVWIKMLTTDIQGKPLPLSKVGYVELLDENAAQCQIKIELHEGIGQGWMELPATLSTGNYRLVAYTRYMQNEGEDCFSGRT